MVVDPGAGAKQLEAGLRQLGLSLSDIGLLLLTHYHYDHRGPAATIKQTSGCEIAAHPADAPAIQDHTVFKRVCGILGSPIEDRWDTFVSSVLRLEPCPVTRLLREGDRLCLGDTEWLILHTPGHSPGHFSLYEPTQRFLFAADIDLTSFGPWYGNIASDLPAFRRSIHRLRELAASNKNVTLTTSHRLGAIPKPAQALAAYAAHLDWRNNRILALLSQPKTLDQLIDSHIIYRTFPLPLFRFFEGIMIQKHLAELHAKGLVEENPPGIWRLTNRATYTSQSQAMESRPPHVRRESK